MRNQACEPCAKRKVRCDREEPCFNCKRRKQDRCVYSDITPAERIKQLEGLVRALGGDPVEPSNNHPPKSGSSASIPADTPPVEGQAFSDLTSGKSKDPVILEENGEQYYVESQVYPCLQVEVSH